MQPDIGREPTFRLSYGAYKLNSLTLTENPQAETYKGARIQLTGAQDSFCKHRHSDAYEPTLQFPQVG